MSLVQALSAIDAAHAEDPRKTESGRPYELVYAEKCTLYLSKLNPEADELLQLAVRAQHFKRWQVPRDTYPMTKAGYFAWRTGLKARQAGLASTVCAEAGYDDAQCARIASMIRKDAFKRDKDTQTLEDVACCVFLEDYFEEFRVSHSEEKMIGVLKKTWPKMSERGHQVALQIDMTEEGQKVVAKALA